MHDRKLGLIDVATALFAVVIMLFLVFAVTAGSASQNVGDLIEFQAKSYYPANSLPTVEARIAGAVPQGGQPVVCALDTRAIHQSGGSLLILLISGDNSSYRVHWSGGGPSSARGRDCGKEVDLVLDRSQLSQLYQSADLENGRMIPKDSGAATQVAPMTIRDGQ